MRHHLILVATLTTVFAATSAPVAQEKVDADIQWKIRREATEHSQILRTLHFLTDVYGPRLTGSPNLKAAQDWVVQETTRWGLKNAHLEPWNFGHPGWVNEKLVGARDLADQGFARQPRRSRGRRARTERSPRRPCN